MRLKQNAGFTMVELMVALGITAITLAATLPSFGHIMQTNGLKSGSENITANIRLARQMAIADGDSRILVWDNQAFTYTIVRDLNDDTMVNAGEPKLGPFSLPKGIEWKSPATGTNISGSQIVFTQDGQASQTGSVVIFNAEGDAATMFILGPTGQVYLDWS